MSSADSDDQPTGDETRAFQQYYLGGGAGPSPSPSRGLLYRLLVGWWKKG